MKQSRAERQCRAVQHRYQLKKKQARQEIKAKYAYGVRRGSNRVD
jgi:hypothetical protein